MRLRFMGTHSASLEGAASIAAATLAECRRQVRDIEQAFAPDPVLESSKVEDGNAISYAPLLERLEDTARTLRELLGGSGDSASNYPVRLVLGATHSMMGRLLGSIGEGSSAINHYSLAREYFEQVPAMMTAGDEDAARHYVQALEEIGRRKDAVDLLIIASALGVLSLSFYLEYASILNRSGDTEDGARILLAAGRQAAGNPDQLYRLGDAAQCGGHTEIAREAFWRASDLFGERREWRESLQACQRALDIPPRDLELVAQRGSLLVRLGRFAEALPDAEESEGISVNASVRLDLAKACVWAGKIDLALTSISEALGSMRESRAGFKGSNGLSDEAEALCLESEAYNRASDWRNALQCAERALELQPESPALALTQKAIAADGLNRYEEAWESVEEALKIDPDNVLASIVRLDLQLKLSRELNDPDAQLEEALSRALELNAGFAFVAGPLIRILSRMGRWQILLEVLGRLDAIGPASNDLFLQKSTALRRLGRQDEAMHELDRVSAAGQTVDFFLLKAALLCDSGDFDGALTLLRPATTPIEQAPHLILTLRGWANQNCTRADCAADGVMVYQRALELKPEDEWSRKGLANALMRLEEEQQKKGKKEEAFREYDKVIEVALERKRRGTLDPYDFCLAGWCFYCTNRFKEAADFYESGLAAVEVGVAAQFDYALVLLADASFTAARLQYERSIRDAETKNSLRQCGLLYVALFDLRIALVRYPDILGYSETYEFRNRLREALQNVLENLPAQWDYLARRMSEYVEADSREAEVQEENSVAPRPVGVELDDLQRPCAVLTPIFQEPNASASFYQLPSSASSTGRARAAAFSASSKVLLISTTMLAAMDMTTPHALEPELQWQQIEWDPKDAPAWFWTAMATSDGATRILDRCAELLVGRSVALLTEYLKTGQTVEERRLAAAKAARFALEATHTQGLVDRAILAWGAAHDEATEDAWGAIRSAIPESSFANPEDVKEKIRVFRENARLRACNDIGVPQSAERGMAESDNKYIQGILKRAHEIAQIVDPEEQYRAAMQAATEMQILVPLTPELESLQKKLGEDLKTQGTFYLENDESVLLMSREPPFYTSSVLVALSGRPGVYSIGFLRAADRIARSPAGFPEALNEELTLQTRTLWKRM